MNFMGGDEGIQTFQTPHIFVAKVNIYVLSDLALFGKDAVVKREMTVPKRIEHVRNGFVFTRQNNFQLA
jgi:hypothetical protein